MRTVSVVGASLAGFSAAQQLRAQGFDGRLVIVGDEVHPPYDRPPLSKGFLKGTVNTADLDLADSSDYQELEAEWILGEPAGRLRPENASVELVSGREVVTDAIVCATGASARRLPHAHGVDGVHTLRTLDDATGLRDELTVGRPRVVVVGAGFIGGEVASSCVDLGLDVTLVESAELPLERALGSRMARACAELHSDAGVDVRFGVAIEELRTSFNRIVGVVLSSGEEVPADVVVMGVGVNPNTGWLGNTGVAVGDGVLCDAGGITDMPNIVALGDVARVHRPDLGRTMRIEHWTNANKQARVAVANLLAGSMVEQHVDLPYFWSDQYGVRIQFTGIVNPEDDVRIVDGAPEDRCFLAQYERDGIAVGVMAFNNPRAFGRARRQLSTPQLITP